MTAFEPYADDDEGDSFHVIELKYQKNPYSVLAESIKKIDQINEKWWAPEEATPLLNECSLISEYYRKLLFSFEYYLLFFSPSF
jgi:hypothetical protein